MMIVSLISTSVCVGWGEDQGFATLAFRGSLTLTVL